MQNVFKKNTIDLQMGTHRATFGIYHSQKKHLNSVL